MNGIELSLFVSRLEAVCEEMGAVLRRTAFSPNIKDRLDFSCALFDAKGELCAQAAHIPVHLGSMAYAMGDIVNKTTWHAGDILILNDPFLGGTHLPDVTFVSPVFHGTSLEAFVVNRAHHANIGSDSPGSMPNASRLEDEGLIIEPQLLFARGELCEPVWAKLAAQLFADEAKSISTTELSGDFAAQTSANKIGEARLSAILQQMGSESFRHCLTELNLYGERLASAALAQIPAGVYPFRDVMDDDGYGNCDITIAVQLEIKAGKVNVDFSGTAEQVTGSINCPLSVAAAAVYYVFRCLMPAYTPACAGIFRAIELNAPTGTLVNAQRPAAVAAGNVETSSRIVDVVLGALQQALPELIPAASQGTMNNVAMGMHADTGSWDYYETIAGGMGAGALHPGLSAVHTHMTNTLNTPIESLELHYPLRISRYALHKASGGVGKHKGGDGLIREYEFLQPASFSLLTERRSHQPWGSAGGAAGAPGCNLLNGQPVPAKFSAAVQAGDILTIVTPAGGGWGKSGQAPD